MRELSRWQLISFISRGTAMGLGIIQSFFIVRLLTVGEWGIVQIAVSLGGALGIYQHLGLASASTREISAARDSKEIFKIFVTSVVIRYFVTVPIAIGLFVFAERLAFDVYDDPTLVLPFKLYATVLLFQGFQSILNSVISGMKRFKHLFIYQGAIAVVSLLLYIPLVFLYRVNGYFIALLGFNVIATLVLSVLAFKPIKAEVEWPSIRDFKRLFKELFSISIGIYLVKILYTNWEKFGPNVLGLTLDAEVVGYFGFALLYAKKLMNVSDAVTDVNLPVFSDKFVNARDQFELMFRENFNKLFSFIVFVGSSAVFWAPDIVRIAVGGDKYDPSLPLIYPLVFAFITYSFVNIIKSSVIIPAKLTKEMVLSFALLIGGTAAFYFLSIRWFENLHAMAYALVFGAVLSLVSLALVSLYKLKFKIFNHNHVLIFTLGALMGFSTVLEAWYLKIPLYLVFAALYLWGNMAAHFITKEEIVNVSHKLRSRRFSK